METEIETAEKAPGKREARKQDRREAILAVARRMFLENGYSATSMSAISAELGGSKGTLWSYFPSKEELFGAVLDETTSAYRRQLADLLKPGEDVGATVLQFCRSFIAKVTSPEGLALHRLVVAEGSRFPEVGEIFYRRAPRATQEMLAAFFAGAMDAGALRRDDPLRAARVLASLCVGGAHQRMLWGQKPTDAEREQEAALAAEIFLRAYAPE
ncbi:TetR/AcrR family transcriptional regulator [Sphingomonas sp.]|uniref:TetR/AcrR family transcriptional regulator n=1 Tax=Sphingomonas sp. TaxID=28214 RepID=UPI001B000BBD|nr:TetR/AcrR family transcriptional regulator [Sphingomonas sp.]MBO9712727.1 TetR/AcrR family transcriptional regulator [Sphingomonas sp.]